MNRWYAHTIDIIPQSFRARFRRSFNHLRELMGWSTTAKLWQENAENSWWFDEKITPDISEHITHENVLRLLTRAHESLTDIRTPRSESWLSLRQNHDFQSRLVAETFHVDPVFTALPELDEPFSSIERAIVDAVARVLNRYDMSFSYLDYLDAKNDLIDARASRPHLSFANEYDGAGNVEISDFNTGQVLYFNRLSSLTNRNHDQ